MMKNMNYALDYCKFANNYECVYSKFIIKTDIKNHKRLISDLLKLLPYVEIDSWVEKNETAKESSITIYTQRSLEEIIYLVRTLPKVA